MQVHRGLLGRLAPQLRDLGQRLAGERLQRLGLELDEQHVLRRSRAEQEVLPLVRRRAHLLGHALPDLRLLQALDPGVEPAFLHPGRHRGVEAGRAGGVGVHVGADRETLLACGFDARDQRPELGPVRRASRLEVVDLGPQLRAPGDVDQLVDGLEQPIALAAHVADVHAAVGRGGLAQRDQLVGPGVEGRGVDQRRAHAERAFLHRLPDERLHPREFLGRRRPVVVIELVHAHGGRADEGRDVQGHPALLEVREILAQRGPADVELEVALLFEHLLLHLLVERTHRLALAEDLERDALASVRETARVDDQRVDRPGEHVDEARRDRAPGRVDLEPRAPRDVADGDDPVAADRDVADTGLPAGAVDDRAVADDEIELVGPGRRAGAEQQSEAEDGFHLWSLQSFLIASPKAWPTR